MAWLLDKIFGVDELQATGDAADAKLAAMNQADYGEGGRIYTLIEDKSGKAVADAAQDVVLANLKSSQTGNVSGAIEGAFDDGWNEGKANVAGTVRGVFNIGGDVIGAVLKGVPWWIWALLLLYFGWPIIAPLIARKAAGK